MRTFVLVAYFALSCAASATLRTYNWTNDLAAPASPPPTIELGQADDFTLNLTLLNGGSAVDLTNSYSVLYVWDRDELLYYVTKTGTCAGSTATVNLSYPESNLPHTNAYAAAIKIYTIVSTSQVVVTEALKPRWKTTFSPDADGLDQVAGYASTNLVFNISITGGGGGGGGDLSNLSNAVLQIQANIESLTTNLVYVSNLVEAVVVTASNNADRITALELIDPLTYGGAGTQVTMTVNGTIGDNDFEVNSPAENRQFVIDGGIIYLINSNADMALSILMNDAGRVDLGVADWPGPGAYSTNVMRLLNPLSIHNTAGEAVVVIDPNSDPVFTIGTNTWKVYANGDVEQATNNAANLGVVSAASVSAATVSGAHSGDGAGLTGVDADTLGGFPLSQISTSEEYFVEGYGIDTETTSEGGTNTTVISFDPGEVDTGAITTEAANVIVEFVPTNASFASQDVEAALIAIDSALGSVGGGGGGGLWTNITEFSITQNVTTITVGFEPMSTVWIESSGDLVLTNISASAFLTVQVNGQTNDIYETNWRYDLYGDAGRGTSGGTVIQDAFALCGVADGDDNYAAYAYYVGDNAWRITSSPRGWRLHGSGDAYYSGYSGNYTYIVDGVGKNLDWSGGNAMTQFMFFAQLDATGDIQTLASNATFKIRGIPQ